MTLTQDKIAIEDLYVDILHKARRGLQLTPEELAERCGLPLSTIQPVLNGEPNPAIIDKLAFVLNLHGPSLIDSAQGNWYPNTVPAFPGLAMFTTIYGDMTVNAYLIWDPETREAASFDTGSTSQPMLDYLQTHQLTLKRICITHTHQDHLADLETLQVRNPNAVSYGSAIENPLGLRPLKHGDGLLLGSLKIRILGTHGHTPGGLSYYIEGLSQPIVVVGDAMFAGSMGGAPYAYQDALRNNQELVLSLPENTVICPGHGPLTTVGEERIHNPFFPAFKTR